MRMPQGPQSYPMGRLPDGRDVTCHVIGTDRISMHVSELGASVHRLCLQDGAGPTDVALGHATIDERLTARDFMGATVGRYANRLGRGRFTVDGTSWTVPVNNGPNALHGGPDGFDRRVWTISERAADRLVLELESPHGDQGFPGALQVRVGYEVVGSGVRITYRASTDRATVVSLTNHTYFNLDGEDSASVDQHVLTVPADRVTDVDEDLLPTGELLAVAGTPLDLRAGAVLGRAVRAPHALVVRARGLDHNYVPAGTGMRRVATLTAPQSGRTLLVSSDLPGLQVYTGNFLDGSTAGHSGALYRQGAGIALETQQFPDAPNHPNFPSTTLRPGEVWSARTHWDFTSEPR